MNKAINPHTLAVIILAAGKGTRMKSTLPKVLHEVAGKPMVDYAIDLARSINPKQVITVLSPNQKVIEQHISGRSAIAIQRAQLGTGDAVKSALAHLDSSIEHILILYADTPLITQASCQAMLNALEQYQGIVLGFNAKDPGQYGRLIIQNEQLLRIAEYKDANDQERNIRFCNSGIIALQSSALQKHITDISDHNAKSEFYLTDIIELINKNGGTCHAIEASEDEVSGVNDQSQLAYVNQVMQSTLRKKHMDNGVVLLDPNTVYFHHDTMIAANTTIEPSVYFGPNVNIEEHAHIKAFSYIEDASIASYANIGPFARIRGTSSIGKEARIGNFVEVKNSTIAPGAKAGHLSYLGDAHIQDNANIGAGVITCNYDGSKKHQTSIGKNSFIGSNSALIAPIQIGDGAYVGAGSTLSKDVSSGSLALTRAKLLVKEQWNNNAS